MTQTPSPEEVRRITETVLERPEFRDGSVTLWERFFAWFFRTVPQWAATHPELANIVMVVLTVLLVVLLAHVTYTVVSEFASYRRGPAAAIRTRRGSLEALEEVGARSWTEAFGMARAALADGDVYRTMWITHRILLSVLDGMDRIRFARWKTNSDYLVECEADASPTLAEVTDAYERVVYAHRDFSTEDAARLLSEVEALAGSRDR